MPAYGRLDLTGCLSRVKEIPHRNRQ